MEFGGDRRSRDLWEVTVACWEGVEGRAPWWYSQDVGGQFGLLLDRLICCKGRAGIIIDESYVKYHKTTVIFKI